MALLVRETESEEAVYNNEVPDVDKNKWYSGVVKTACEIGIIKKGENFRPDDSITREEMCGLLIDFYEYENGIVSAAADKVFTDSDKISDTDSVDKAVALELMYGMDDGKFYPSEYATRAEASAVLARYIKK